jgi:hypothetical protein
MTPEDEHVGLIERGVAESLVSVGEAGGLDDEVFVLGELGGCLLYTSDAADEMD